MSDYEKTIDELIEKKLKEALERSQKEREEVAQTTAEKKASAEEKKQESMRGAYADYAKNIDPTGYNAEVMAALGLDKTGKSETAKVGYYNVYQNALSQIRNLSQEELNKLSKEEREALLALDEADSKARENAYASHLSEQVRRQEQEVEQTEKDRQYQLSLAVQALNEKKANADIADSNRQYQLDLQKQQLNEKKANADIADSNRQYQLELSKYNDSKATSGNYPADGTAKERYQWLRVNILSMLDTVKRIGGDAVALVRPFLDLAAEDLSDEYYIELLKLVV